MRIFPILLAFVAAILPSVVTGQTTPDFSQFAGSWCYQSGGFRQEIDVYSDGRAALVTQQPGQPIAADQLLLTSFEGPVATGYELLSNYTMWLVLATDDQLVFFIYDTGLMVPRVSSATFYGPTSTGYGSTVDHTPCGFQ